jgi:virginiamycin A acetyltransferase
MNGEPDELRRTPLAWLLLALAGRERGRRLALVLCESWEGGLMFSATARQILERHHKVTIGAYSYGECFVPGAFPAGVVIGRYVSIAPGVRAFLRNHPLDRLSLHPFFYNHQLGYVPADTIASGSLRIEHDAWIGERAIITPGCKRIGCGAAVGAGAIVTKDVPDFAVVAGNPARVIRSRFPEPTCDLIRRSQWWNLPPHRLIPQLDRMTSPLGDGQWLQSLGSRANPMGISESNVFGA